ncbi:transcriptional regulator [Amycolatopsis antarctica]|uniref:Transcriptional regulator n=1 Tax=Amycolatopsis antarctica TaxID=1854586 RepID=A0A263CVJ6_9PSEU|nr:helix-turn-helix domain-containing protein [Amycolatopsis antarctica]OZM70131.1 transcriptional regulator [Amycolatopsis antarctica]
MTTPGPKTGEAAQDPLRRALELLGDQWTLLILQSVFLRVRRYEELRTRLGISPTALSGRLRAAVEAGILVRSPYRGSGRTRHEYRLTERGLALWPLLVTIWSWERSWVEGRDEVLPTLTHLDCGNETATGLGCAACLRPADLAGTRLHRRPGTAYSGGSGRRFRRKDAEPLAADPLMFFPATMELLGDRWSTGIMLNAFLGSQHFSEFERELGIGPSVLSDRLGRLVAAGVLGTETARTRADARAYRLLPKGAAFFPALAILIDWARDRCPLADGAASVEMRHESCGQRLQPVLLCEHCGVPLHRTALTFDLNAVSASLVGVTR